MLDYAEQALTSIGCVKINLQILADNTPVQAFYEAPDYATESRISMGQADLRERPRSVVPAAGSYGEHPSDSRTSVDCTEPLFTRPTFLQRSMIDV